MTFSVTMIVSSSHDYIVVTENVLKFQKTNVACQIRLDKQHRKRSLFRVFHVCYSDKQYVKTNILFENKKEKRVQNFRTFTVPKIP